MEALDELEALDAVPPDPPAPPLDEVPAIPPMAPLDEASPAPPGPPLVEVPATPPVPVAGLLLPQPALQSSVAPTAVTRGMRARSNRGHELRSEVGWEAKRSEDSLMGTRLRTRGDRRKRFRVAVVKRSCATPHGGQRGLRPDGSSASTAGVQSKADGIVIQNTA